MKILLFVRDGKWWGRNGKDEAEFHYPGEVKPWIVATAVKVANPEAQLLLDHLTTDNPHLQAMLYTYIRFGLFLGKIEWHKIRDAWDRPRHMCTHCKRDAYYDAHDKVYLCASCFYLEGYGGQYYVPIRSRHALPTSRQREKQITEANNHGQRREPKHTSRPQAQQAPLWDAC